MATIKANTKKRIKELLKMIEEKAISNIDKSLNCGAIAENSEFLEDNYLLASALIEDVQIDYKIKTKEHRKEAENLFKFI
jgi:hypothetical protein